MAAQAHSGPIVLNDAAAPVPPTPAAAPAPATTAPAQDDDDDDHDDGPAWESASLYEEILDEVEAFEYSTNGTYTKSK